MTVDQLQDQDSTMRIMPASSGQKANATIDLSQTSHAEFGTRDAMRHGLGQVRHDLVPGHPLERHLNQVFADSGRSSTFLLH